LSVIANDLQLHQLCGSVAAVTLDMLPIGQQARIIAVDWTLLAGEEAERLRALGVDVGAKVSVAHRGVLGGADPIALTIGRMTVALRRAHARVMTVAPVQVEAA
jgi:ferrous iron transport protein A